MSGFDSKTEIKNRETKVNNIGTDQCWLWIRIQCSVQGLSVKGKGLILSALGTFEVAMGYP
jgi:hypothetical protein